MIGMSVLELIILIVPPVLAYILLKRKGNIFSQIIGGTILVLFILFWIYVGLGAPEFVVMVRE